MSSEVQARVIYALQDLKDRYGSDIRSIYKMANRNVHPKKFITLKRIYKAIQKGMDDGMIEKSGTRFKLNHRIIRAASTPNKSLEDDRKKKHGELEDNQNEDESECSAKMYPCKKKRRKCGSKRRRRRCPKRRKRRRCTPKRRCRPRRRKSCRRKRRKSCRRRKKRCPEEFDMLKSEIFDDIELKPRLRRRRTESGIKRRERMPRCTSMKRDLIFPSRMRLPQSPVKGAFPPEGVNFGDGPLMGSDGRF